ncbi:MAG: LPXTG cell wall anchor domain-containing protein [Saprospiraceae bacterium]|nr:LPXTG cell wall anchor domain-containing protein [Saprospiraceae bacterium]
MEYFDTETYLILGLLLALAVGTLLLRKKGQQRGK